MSKYQLVLKFRITSLSDFDRLVSFEEILLQRLPPLGKVDGHDYGEGEFNIFILTNQPQETLDAVDVIHKKDFFDYDATATYRELLAEEPLAIWPSQKI